MNVSNILTIAVFFAVIFSYLYFSKHQHAVREAVLITLLFAIFSATMRPAVVDNFEFQLSPDKACMGGAYMFTSDPAMAQYCAQFSPEQRAGFQCAHGFVGAPQIREVEATGQL